MERYSEPTQYLPETLPQMLKPLRRLNFILGTFPYTISFENGRISLSKKSVHYYRALFTLVLVILSVFFILLRIIQVILSTREVDSNGNLVPILGGLVELVCSVYANFITMIILALLFLKMKVVKAYLSEMVLYSETLRGYLDSPTVFSAVRKLYTLYAFLGLTAASTVAVRCLQNPSISPLSVFFEFTGLDAFVTPGIITVASAAFAFYLAVVKYTCLGNLEVVSCSQAICLSRSIENIMEYLEGQMEIWKRQFKGLETKVIDKEDFLNLLSFASPEPLQRSSKSANGKLKMQNSFETYIDQIREFNPGLVGSVSSPTHSLSSGDLTIPKIHTGMSLSGFKTSPGRALGHAARKYLSVASMQTTANSVFGVTLAINIGCVVGMTVILKYLVIKSFISHFREDHWNAQRSHELSHEYTTLENWTTTMMPPTAATNDTMNATSDSDLNSLLPSLQWNSFHFDSGSLEWMVLLGLDTSMFIRLCVTVLCLGRVHSTSLKFNQVMGRAFLTANRIIDEIATNLASTKDDVANDFGKDVEQITRLLMTPTQQSSIIAFMNLNNANPAAFTAGGLFVFSRGLLLMIVSIVVSYLVFLLQAS